jgi:DNA-binding MarR family transcriptional regulator
MSWVQRASRLSGRTWQVATALWFVGIRSKSKSATVTLTEKTRRRFNLSRSAITRALKQLAGAGLIVVKEQSGRRSVVTILPAEVELELRYAT